MGRLNDVVTFVHKNILYSLCGSKELKSNGSTSKLKYKSLKLKIYCF